MKVSMKFVVVAAWVWLVSWSYRHDNPAPAVAGCWAACVLIQLINDAKCLE